MTKRYSRIRVVSWAAIAEAAIDSEVIKDGEIMRAMRDELDRRGPHEWAWSAPDLDDILHDAIDAVMTRAEPQTLARVAERTTVVCAVFTYLHQNPMAESRIDTPEGVYEALTAQLGAPTPDTRFVGSVLASHDPFKAAATRWLTECDRDEPSTQRVQPSVNDYRALLGAAAVLVASTQAGTAFTLPAATAVRDALACIPHLCDKLGLDAHEEFGEALDVYLGDVANDSQVRPDWDATAPLTELMRLAPGI